MPQPENDYPDCERCDDTRLDPDAYIPHETKHGTAYWHAPCGDCQPETDTAGLPCPHCRGTGGDPEDEGDWIPEVHQHNPYSAGPCPRCNGRGTVTEQEAAETLAQECADHASVILWCADRVRSVDGSDTVQDAADYLHALSTRAQVDTDPVTDRAAVIRWCAQQIHSMGGDYDVERAADYLDDLAAEAVWVQHGEAVSARQEGERRQCGYTQRHPSHTFLRLEVLFQCPGEPGTEAEQ